MCAVFEANLQQNVEILVVSFWDLGIQSLSSKLSCYERNFKKHLTLSLVRIWWGTLFMTASTLPKKCPYSEFFWSVLYSIRIEYREIRSIFKYSVRMREIRTRKIPNTDAFHAVLFMRKKLCIMSFQYCIFYLFPSCDW